MLNKITIEYTVSHRPGADVDFPGNRSGRLDRLLKFRLSRPGRRKLLRDRTGPLGEMRCAGRSERPGHQ